MSIVNIPVRNLNTQIQVVNEYKETQTNTFLTMEEQLFKYLGYKVKVWEILTWPRTEAEKFCKRRIYESLATKALLREERKNLYSKK